MTAKGKSFNLSDGIVRLTPGSVEQDEDGVRTLEIAMWPTANTFRAGHRIRLQVSSGAHPLFNRNAGTGRAAGHRRQPALGRPGGLPRRRAPVLHRAARGAASRRTARWASAEWVRPTPSASLPRMTQPTFVPIAEADQVRPARHLHVPGDVDHGPPGRARGADHAPGRQHRDARARLGLRAAPGPPVRATSSSWARASPSTMCCSASPSSPPSGPPSSAGRRASTTSSSPSTCGASSIDVPAGEQETRRAQFSSISHDYVAQRALVDSVPEETLRLSPDEVRAGGGPAA